LAFLLGRLVLPEQWTNVRIGSESLS